MARFIVLDCYGSDVWEMKAFVELTPELLTRISNEMILVSSRKARNSRYYGNQMWDGNVFIVEKGHLYNMGDGDVYDGTLPEGDLSKLEAEPLLTVTASDAYWEFRIKHCSDEMRTNALHTKQVQGLKALV